MKNAVSGLVVHAGRAFIIALHTQETPSEPEWDHYLAHCERAFALMSGDSSKVAGITITDGGAPNARQRARLNAFIEGKAIRGAVVTNSALVRGVVTALSWANPHIKAFSPTRLNEGLLHTGFPAADALLLWREVRKLREGAAPVATVDTILAGLDRSASAP